MATERIAIIFSESGSRVVRYAIRGLADEATRASPAIDSLKAALLGVASGAAVAQLTRMSDEILRLRNRLNYVTGDTTAAAAVFTKLQDASDETRSSLSATGELYTRFALATRHMGLTADEVVGMVKSLNEAVVLSGANAREAEAGLLQFSQGLASNRLAGDELRAVLEQLPLLADIIGKELGVQRGALRFLAKEGQITADVIVRAMQKMATELGSSFKDTVPTISQSLVVLHNAVLRVLDDIDKSTGIFGSASAAILYLAKNIDTVARVVIAGVLVAAIYTAIAAVTALGVALATNPLGILVFGIIAAASALAVFSDKIILVKDQGITLRDVLIAAFQEIWKTLKPILDELVQYWETDIWPTLQELPGAVSETLSNVLGSIAKAVDYAIAYFVGFKTAFERLWDAFSPTTKNVFIGIANSAIESFNLIYAGLKGLWDSIVYLFKHEGERVLNFLSAIGDSITETLNGNWAEAAAALKDALHKFSQTTVNTATVMADSVKQTLAAPPIDRLKEAVSTSGESLGDAYANGFLEGFDRTLQSGPAQTKLAQVASFFDLQGQSGLANFVRRVKDRAAAMALERKRAEDRAAFFATKNVPEDVLAAQEQTGLKSLQQVQVETMLWKINNETAALSQLNRERRVQNDLLKMEKSLRQQGLVFTDEERAQVTLALRKKDALEEGQKALKGFYDTLGTTEEGYSRLLGIQDEFNKGVDSLLERFQKGEINTNQLNLALDNLTRSLEDQSDVYKGIQNPQVAYERRMAAIKKVLETTTDSLERQNLELEKTNALIEKLDKERGPAAGAQRSLLKYSKDATDFAKNMETVVTNAFQGMEDALTNFITTGKLGFRELVNSIAADMARLAVRQFITGPLASGLAGAFGNGESGSGGFSGFWEAFSGGHRASGGPVLAGQTYLVGEKGPELLQMGNNQSGWVHPNPSDSAGGQVVRPIRVNMNIYTQDAGSFNRSERQVTRAASRAIRRAAG